MQYFRAPGYKYGPLKAGLSGEAAGAQSLLLCARNTRGFELFAATKQMVFFQRSGTEKAHMEALATTTPILLSQKHLQALKDIYKFSGIRRYHGMLPEKHALLYDQDVLGFLEENDLIEEGTVIARCGSKMTGFRLTDNARRDLKAMGVELDSSEPEPQELPTEDEDGCLTREQIDILADLYHFSRIKKFNGITPKKEIEDYDKRDIKLLYELGYILYIQLKGRAVRHAKGYILTEQAMRLLRRLGIAY